MKQDLSKSGGEELALLGHDLRAALGDMRAGLKLLERQEAPPALQGLLTRCHAAAEALSRLIDQSVMVCLGQASPVSCAYADIPTQEFLTKLRHRWDAAAADSGHSFALIAAGDLPKTFRLDRTALERVIANLVGNALHHTPPGDVRLTFKISDSDLLLLSVEDDGPGFPAEHLAIIERDFALPPEARRVGGGLGLQSVKTLVQAMGGRCNARNKAGGGAEVGICLPLPDQCTAEAGQLAAAPDLSGTRLLLVDDSAAARELGSILGRSIGASVETAASGQEAMARLAESTLPDVMILDDEMPGATGAEVLRWLRRQGGPAARLPVLALTSHIAPTEVAALHEAGADAVLAKPLLCPLELGRALLRAQGRDADRPAMAEMRGQAFEALQRLQDLAGPVASVELFQRMEEDLARAAAGLAQAATAGDMGAIRAHSHVIIALAGTAGVTELHEDAVSLNGMAQGQMPAERVIAFARRLDVPIRDLIAMVRGFARAQEIGPSAT